MVRFGADTSGFNSGLRDAKNGLNLLSKLTNSISGIAAMAMIKMGADIGKGFKSSALTMANGFADASLKAVRFTEKINKKYDTLSSKIKQVSAEVERMDAGYEAYEKATKEVEKYENAIKNAIKSASAYIAGGGERGDEKWQELVLAVSGFKSKLEETIKVQQNLDSQGFSAVSSEYGDLIDQQSKLLDSLTAIEDKAEQGPGAWSRLAAGITGSFKSIPAAFKNVVAGVLNSGKTLASGAWSIFKKIGSYAKAGLQKVGSVIKSVFSKISEHFKKSGGEAGKFTKALNGSLGVLARMVKRRFFQAILNQAKEGIQELAKFSPAFNQALSGLQSSFKFAGNSLVAAFAPIVTHVVPYLTLLIDKLAQAMNMIARFTGALLGQKTVATAVKTQEDYAASLGDTAKETKEADKETKKALAGFDEINTLNNGKDDSSSGTSGGGSSSPFTYSDVGPASSFADQIKALFDAKDFEAIGQLFADKCNEFIHRIQNLDWDGIGRKVNGAVKGFAEAVNGFVDRLDWYAIGDVIGKGLNVGFGAINTFFETIKWDRLGEQIANGLNGLVDSFDWELAGKTVGNGVNAIIDTLHGAFTTFKWKELGEGAGTSLNAAIDRIDFVKAGQTLNAGITGALDTVNAFFKETDWLKIGESLIELVEGIDYGGICSRVWQALGSALGAAAGIIAGAIKKVWTDHIKPAVTKEWERLKEEFGKGFWNGVNALFDDIAGFFKKIGTWVKEHVVDPFVKGFKDALGIHSPSKVMQDIGDLCIEGFTQGVKDLWDRAKQFFTDTVEGIKNIFGNIGTWFGERFSAAWESMKKAFSGVGEFFSNMWDGIKNGIKGAINGIIGFINGMISAVTNGVNAVIRGLNRLQIDIPDWMGGGTFGFNIAEVQAPQIPMLAGGGIAYDDAFVNVAEYAGSRSNPEVIAPLDRLVSILKGAMGTSGTQVVNVTCVLEDGTIVGRTTQTIRRNNRRGLEGVA